MSFFRTWCCAFCGKQVTLDIEREEVGIPVFEAKLPEGWIWFKYRSIRLPANDTRTLGCCLEHAQKAAEKFAVPSWTG